MAGKLPRLQHQEQGEQEKKMETKNKATTLEEKGQASETLSVLSSDNEDIHEDEEEEGEHSANTSANASDDVKNLVIETDKSVVLII
ncbi:MAG TPA: hypothetical protein VK133_00345 [Amoebophilaceae bacterium]|nr:hypothetical protein [Amoebophilaceae bacterium]